MKECKYEKKYDKKYIKCKRDESVRFKGCGCPFYKRPWWKIITGRW